MTYVRLSAGNHWRRQVDADGTASASAIKLKNLVVNKLMAHVTGDNGILRKSTDSGRTWTNAGMLSGADACLDVCEDPDGNIFGLFMDTGTTTAKVGLSTNAMVSWTELYEHDAGRQAFNISCSPERSAFSKIAFLARNNTGVDEATQGSNSELVISTDSGATWDTKSLGYKLALDADAPLIEFLPGSINVMLRGEAVASLPLAYVDFYDFQTMGVNSLLSATSIAVDNTVRAASQPSVFILAIVSSQAVLSVTDDTANNILGTVPVWTQQVSIEQFQAVLGSFFLSVWTAPVEDLIYDTRALITMDGVARMIAEIVGAVGVNPTPIQVEAVGGLAPLAGPGLDPMGGSSLVVTFCAVYHEFDSFLNWRPVLPGNTYPEGGPGTDGPLWLQLLGNISSNGIDEAGALNLQDGYNYDDSEQTNPSPLPDGHGASGDDVLWSIDGTYVNAHMATAVLEFG